MRRRLARSLKHKLMLVILLTTGVALFFAFAAHAFLQYFTTRNELLQVASSMAEVVAANSTAALTFDDPRAAQQTLSSLRVRPSIVSACLYAPSGAVFSTYHRHGADGDPLPPAPGSDGHLFGGGHLVLFRPVMLDGERVGTVYLKMELTEVVQQQIRYAGMILLFLAGSGFVAVLVASRLQRIVSGPILGLADAARSVSQSRDYSVRVPVQAEDEIGSLSEAFNTMLGRIETDGAALQATQHDLKAKVQDLEREVSEREEAEKALKLSEEQLIQAQKMEAIGRLAGGVAHDFNNLLTVINGYSELMEAQLPDDEDLRSSLREIHRAGERAAALTRQLLAFSRKQVLQPELLDLNAVVSEVEKLLRRLIGEDVALVTRLDPALGSVKADPGQLEQVLMNLAVNARDAMPEGGTLTIETANAMLDTGFAMAHPGARSGEYAVLTVADTGIGMSDEVRSHAFEPFFTTKDQGKGTGLGLATAYGIVKQSDGYITVDSEAGRGTTFRIYLPRAAGAAVPSGLGERPAQSPRGTETILLVEDEPGVRRLSRTILEAQGYSVLEAASGDEALKVARSHTGVIHLVATDVIMPGMSGRVLWDRLRVLRPDARVLFMSGYTDDAIARHGVLERGIAFLQKPFTPQRLAEKVREVLDAAPGAGA